MSFSQSLTVLLISGALFACSAETSEPPPSPASTPSETDTAAQKGDEKKVDVDVDLDTASPSGLTKAQCHSKCMYGMPPERTRSKTAQRRSRGTDAETTTCGRVSSRAPS